MLRSVFVNLRKFTRQTTSVLGTPIALTIGVAFVLLTSGAAVIQTTGSFRDESAPVVSKTAASAPKTQIKPDSQMQAHMGPVTSAKKPLALSDFEILINKSSDSVVKITGSGCGYEFSGSGFVVAPNLVATNAHVIAGVSVPHVIDSKRSYVATTILFDPELDFAVLRVSDLAGVPMVFNQSSSYAINRVGSHNNDQDVILGYPGGGDFKAELAVVTDEYIAEMNDIYGNAGGSRDIYEVRAHVIPGNSGGPLIQQDGKVAGIVFAIPPDRDNAAYVMPTTDFYDEIQQAKTLYAPVGVHKCINVSV